MAVPNAAEDIERAKLVHNEQTKLRATLLNTVSGGSIIAGIVTPIVSAVRPDTGSTGNTLLLMLVWFLLSALLHIGATGTLERLR